MMIRGTSTMLFMGGVMLFVFAKFIPFLEYLSMDWLGVFMMVGGIFILLFCFSPSQTGLQYDTIPAGSSIVNFIRRDANIVPLLGKRVFSGESFLDVPKLGLIEDLGKDTVFLWGRKKVRFGLENISYTPDPRYFNITHELYRLGFDDSDDLYNVLNIPNMDAEQDRVKKTHYLIRMAEIYWNMTHMEPHGAERLVESFKRKPEKRTVFGKKKPPLSRLKEEHDRNKQQRQQTQQEPKKHDTMVNREELDEWLNSRK